jgi:hypothetical protein
MAYQIGDLIKYRRNTEQGYCVIQQIYASSPDSKEIMKVLWLAYCVDNKDYLQNADAELHGTYPLSAIEGSGFWNKIA